MLTGFWDWYAGLSDAARAQAIAPLMNKLRAFLLRPFVKAAIAGGPSTLDMRAVLDDGGICLVRIPKGSLGEETTRLVGSLVVASVWQTATARAALPQNLRADCGLYVDECQNFLNLPYPLEDMLAEARGFRLGMTLAHQHLGQLSRDLHDGISANARNKIFFTASPDDARSLARHTAPRLSEHDLAHLDAFHAAARLVVAGQATAPFTFTTNPLPPAVPGRDRAIRRASARALSQSAAPPLGPRRDRRRTSPDRIRPPPRATDQPDHALDVEGHSMTTDTTGHAPTSTTPTSPVPQRGLRAHRPPRPSDRAAVSAEHLGELSHRLTARDRWLAHLLLEHRVLTSTQIVQLGFGVAPHRQPPAAPSSTSGASWTGSNPSPNAGPRRCTTSSTSPGPHILAAAWGLDPGRPRLPPRPSRRDRPQPAPGPHRRRHRHLHRPGRDRPPLRPPQPRQCSRWWRVTATGDRLVVRVPLRPLLRRPTSAPTATAAGAKHGRRDRVLPRIRLRHRTARPRWRTSSPTTTAWPTRPGSCTPVLFWFPTLDGKPTPVPRSSPPSRRCPHSRMPWCRSLPPAACPPTPPFPAACPSARGPCPTVPPLPAGCPSTQLVAPGQARRLVCPPLACGWPSSPTAWPTLAHPVTAAEGPSGSAPRAARVIRSGSAGRSRAAAAKRSWPPPAGMPPGPNDQSVGRDQRAVA